MSDASIDIIYTAQMEKYGQGHEEEARTVAERHIDKGDIVYR